MVDQRKILHKHNSVVHLVGKVGSHLLDLLPPEAGRGGQKLVDVLAVLDVKELQLLPGGHPANGSATGGDDSITSTWS